MSKIIISICLVLMLSIMTNGCRKSQKNPLENELFSGLFIITDNLGMISETRDSGSTTLYFGKSRYSITEVNKNLPPRSSGIYREQNGIVNFWDDQVHEQSTDLTRIPDGDYFYFLQNGSLTVWQTRILNHSKQKLEYKLSKQ